MSNKEADVQIWVRKYIEKAFEENVYAFKVPQGQYTSRRGIPDLVFSIHGKFVAIEVKTKSGSLTKLQQFELDKINNVGGQGYVVYGKDKEMMEIIIQDVRDGL